MDSSDTASSPPHAPQTHITPTSYKAAHKRPLSLTLHQWILLSLSECQHSGEPPRPTVSGTCTGCFRIELKNQTQIYIYIYIYAFSRRFYPKRLTLHSSDSFYILSALAFPGNRTHDLGVANAMLYQLSYRKAVYRSIDVFSTSERPVISMHAVTLWNTLSRYRSDWVWLLWECNGKIILCVCLCVYACVCVILIWSPHGISFTASCPPFGQSQENA